MPLQGRAMPDLRIAAAIIKKLSDAGGPGAVPNDVLKKLAAHVAQQAVKVDEGSVTDPERVELYLQLSEQGERIKDTALATHLASGR